MPAYVHLNERGQVIEISKEKQAGIDYLKVDGFALLFLALSAVLWLLTTVYAVGYLEGSPHQSRFFAFFSFWSHIHAFATFLILQKRVVLQLYS